MSQKFSRNFDFAKKLRNKREAVDFLSLKGLLLQIVADSPFSLSGSIIPNNPRKGPFHTWGRGRGEGGGWSAEEFSLLATPSISSTELRFSQVLGWLTLNFREELRSRPGKGCALDG